MSINLTYPSVLAFLQSSILLQKEGGQNSTPTETAPGAFFICCCPATKGVRGAHLRGGQKSSLELGRLDGNHCSLFGRGSLEEIDFRPWKMERN